MSKINLNDIVTLQLNQYGKEIYARSFTDIGLKAPENDGIISLPIWDMAYIFGAHLYMGGQMPFETTVFGHEPCDDVGGPVIEKEPTRL